MACASVEFFGRAATADDFEDGDEVAACGDEDVDVEVPAEGSVDLRFFGAISVSAGCFVRSGQCQHQTRANADMEMPLYEFMELGPLAKK